MSSSGEREAALLSAGGLVIRLSLHVGRVGYDTKAADVWNGKNRQCWCVTLIICEREVRKKRVFSPRWPVQYEVLSEDEFARALDGPPDEADHQHLQPRALQQLHLVVEGQLQETWRDTHSEKNYPSPTAAWAPLKPDLCVSTAGETGSKVARCRRRNRLGRGQGADYLDQQDQPKLCRDNTSFFVFFEKLYNNCQLLNLLFIPTGQYEL